MVDRENMTILFFNSFFLFIFFRRFILRDAWTDFHETLPHDVVCFDKVYPLIFAFSMHPTESGGTKEHTILGHLSWHHFQFKGYCSETKTQKQKLNSKIENSKTNWVVGAYYHWNGLNAQGNAF